MPNAIVAENPSFNDLIAADADVTLLQGGFKFLEGPVWQDGRLIFSDIPADAMYAWSPEAGVKAYRSPSFRSNGNTLDLQGNLVSCEHGSRVVSVTVDDERKVLLDRFNGKLFNSPNDVVVRNDGSVWFTDPPYGLPADKRAELMEQEGKYVFCFDPNDGSLSKVASDFDMPNGLCFSPDEKRLYIADSGKPKHVRVFNVHGKTLEGGEVFARIEPGVPDGMRCDEHGNLWTTAGDGIHVYSPDGELLGKVLCPETPANTCFGGPNGTTLFMTAKTSLYAVETKVKGAPRPVK